MKRLVALVLFCASLAAQAQTPLQLEADLNAHPEKMGVRLQLTGIYLKDNEYDKVIALLNSYTDQLPVDGFLALANSYSSKKDYTNEIRVLSLLSVKHETDFRWNMLLAQAYIKSASGQTDSDKNHELVTLAIQQLRKVLKSQSKYKPAYDLLLSTLLINKLDNEAREVLTEGIEKFGERAELYRDLCRLDSMDGFLMQATQNCRKAISMAPSFPDNYVYLVQSLYDQKDAVQAEKDVVIAGKRFPQSEFVQWAAGTLFLKKKNFPVASRYFKAALSAEPKSGRAHFGLAQALFESGSAEASLEHFVIACRTEATAVDIFLAAGGKLKQSGKEKIGQEFVQKANNCRN